MRLALVVLVACSCGSITPVSPLTSSDAGGESRLDTYQPDHTSQADAAGDAGPGPCPNLVGAELQQCSAPAAAVWAYCFTNCRAQAGGAAPAGCTLGQPNTTGGTICVASCGDCY